MLGNSVNYADIVILLLLVSHVARGVKQGVWSLLARLAAFAGSIALAFMGYRFVGDLINSRFGSFPSIGYVLGFVIVLAVGHVLISVILRAALAALPESWHRASWSKALATIPAFVDASIVVAMLVLVSVVLPVPTAVRSQVTESRLGSAFLGALEGTERIAQGRFGSTLDDALTSFSTRPDPGERVSLSYSPKSMSVDEASERRMLELLNAERAKVGAPPLELDRELTELARAHSRDMWTRKYFAHEDPDGKSPFDRMDEADIGYLFAGENLAMAPTVGLAHRGLMNSPGHRRNMLDPRFRKVGIGAVDGGIYGKMFTQSFSG